MTKEETVADVTLVFFFRWLSMGKLKDRIFVNDVIVEDVCIYLRGWGTPK